MVGREKVLGENFSERKNRHVWHSSGRSYAAKKPLKSFAKNQN